ncbi:MAG: type II toxin-antitoxin system VapB family antitoxin [Phycicoccus sp.]
MALSIKDAETERLARKLARETGEIIMVAVRRAIEEQLTRVRAKRSARCSESDLYDIIWRGGSERPSTAERPARGDASKGW